MLFAEYNTHFFGDSEALDFIEISLANVTRWKYRSDESLELRVTTERPIDSDIVNLLRKNHDFMMYVTYWDRDCGCWSFCNGKEISASLQHHRRKMYSPISYEDFVAKENLLMDVTDHLLHGLSYNGLKNIAELAEMEEGLLIRKAYLVDPVYEYYCLYLEVEASEENNRERLEFCKANKTLVENINFEEQDTLESWEEPKFFNSDKEHVIKLLNSGDLEVCWYWHLTEYEYAALALPEIQRRLKAGDERAASKLEDICFLLEVVNVAEYREWLIQEENFGES